jgi:3-keto-5-aminohexanoate cleavage enzyme
MEDNLMLGKGQPVSHNSELVTRAAEIATLMQRPPMSTTEARALLGIKDRRTR